MHKVYLVIFKWFISGLADSICVATNTEDEAKEYINSKINTTSSHMKGLGAYQIIPVKLYS